MTIKVSLRGNNFIFETKAGLFSKERVDPGSLLLIENVEVEDGNIVVDLGCGYGAIGLAIARLTPNGKVFMVDTDIRAVEYSLLNAENNHIHNVEVLASDGFSRLSQNLSFNVVVSNPPSHTPKETLIEFVEGAKDRLDQGGRIYFVTERRIVPLVKREFIRVFGNHSILCSEGQYSLSSAQNT